CQTIQLTGQTELLASLLGTSRQTLSTLLNRMIRDGLVARPDRQHLILLDTQRLQQLASVS
ncbi:helix-turn-helix domain-containing protein, partial [Wenyingzhuangia sp. 1_MG-2023]|nr:helix-turn-helix domain-containing protein [Wenyingzhuangia sp. 1_MG-2023]